MGDGSHIDLQSGRGQLQIQQPLKEVQYVSDQTMYWIQRPTTAPILKDRTLIHIDGMCGRCHARALRRPTSPLYREKEEPGPAVAKPRARRDPGWGGESDPPSWDSRSLLGGRCIGEPGESLCSS
ncbi:hypothetical protein CHARACLAT_030836 [Characodon lateralis]|uniref:Uncharacterized protein n=1 Tax=Characodon lateralis TaxID=208331 RepID=A0ABU7EP00_9TELE|nr:hypothetical protein [Characodon lateralis]